MLWTELVPPAEALLGLITVSLAFTAFDSGSRFHAGIDAASRRPAEDLSGAAQDIGWTSAVGYLVRWPPQARGARSTKRGSVTEPTALLVPSSRRGPLAAHQNEQ